jgi:hypothetical protein
MNSMRKKVKKKRISLLAKLFIPLVVSSASWASPGGTPITACASDSSTNCTFATLYQNIGMASYSGIQIIYLVSILIGIAGTIFGLLKLKQHASDSQGTSGALRQAIYSLVISSLLISVPVIALLVNGSVLGRSDIPMVPENTIANVGQQNVAN